jgi:hypothetical protein
MTIVATIELDDNQRRILRSKDELFSKFSARASRQVKELPLGSRVHARCYHPEVVEIVESELPARLADACSAWRDGDARAALAIVEGYEIRDCHWQAWRIRFELDANREASAVIHLNELIAQQAPLALGRKPPGLLNLLSALSPEGSEGVSSALVEMLSKLSYQETTARRLAEWLPKSKRPLRYKAWEAKKRALEAQKEQMVIKKTRPAAVWRAARAALDSDFDVAIIHNQGPVPSLAGKGQAQIIEWLHAISRQVTGKSLQINSYQRHDPRVVARKLGEELRETGSKEQQEQLLLKLDQQLLWLELEIVLRRDVVQPAGKQAELRLAICVGARIRCRAFDRSRRPRLWLIELEGDRCGLFCENDGSWSWTEGAYEDLLASIPECWFEQAIMQLEG